MLTSRQLSLPLDKLLYFVTILKINLLQLLVTLKLLYYCNVVA